MTDDQHGEGTPQGAGRWDPLPQGEYDDGATAFVKLPEGGIDALLATSDSPLAAPGHGYVPPPITVTPAAPTATDPSGTGTWATLPAAPADGVQWQSPEGSAGHDTHDSGHDTGHDSGHYGHQDARHLDIGHADPAHQGGHQGGPHHPAGHDGFTYSPGATGQWSFEEATAAEPPPAPAPGHDVTGQWSIPVANGDLPDESGEYTTTSLVRRWGNTPPDTLPGGAAAPWATEGAGQPWAPPAGPETPGGAPEAAGRPVEAVEAVEAVAAATGVTVAETVTDAPAEVPDTEQGPGAPAAQDATDVADVAHTADATDVPEASGTPDERAAREPSAADRAPDDPDAASEPPAGPGPGPDPADSTDPAGSTEPADPPAPPHDDHPLASYVLRVNGTDRPVTGAWIGESLLYVLRERLGLAGAKDGCSQGECGACNVQVDGRLVASCLVPAVTAAGSEVRTVEGLAADGRPSDVQRALAKCGAVQCGFCVPGMAMTVHDLLEGNPAPDELETRQALCGNLCRCSGYRAVVDAVREVVAERAATGAAEHGERDGGEARIPHQAGPGAGGVNPSAFEPVRPQGQGHNHGHGHDHRHTHPGPDQGPHQGPHEGPHRGPQGQDGGPA
ncbi:2Fe-2S iron-sulfur cluster-binding protein [Streptomyces sp. NPDC088789]|uniref:(2Fe-2S)-binding protein n=1 Tax=Streptomyces sp. NPDC088789 TaxID=3365899 RepID=UPI00380CCBBA